MPSSPNSFFRLALVTSMSLCSIGWATAQPTGSHEKLIVAFVARLTQLDENKADGNIAEEDYQLEYVNFLQDEADQLTPHLPGILFSLQKWLSRRSIQELEFEELLSQTLDGAEYDAVWEHLKNNEGKTRSVPRCALTHLLGYLGISTPTVAVRALLDSLPMPERGEDICVANALRTLGPTAYEPLTDRLLYHRSLIELHTGAISLLAQSQETDFPELAGLRESGEWIDRFPQSKRKLIALVKQWKKWWHQSGERYSWDSQSELLRESQP